MADVGSTDVTVDFQVTVDDIVDVAKHIQRTSPSHRRLRRYLTALLFGGIIALNVNRLDSGAAPADIALVVVVNLLIIAAIYWPVFTLVYWIELRIIRRQYAEESNRIKLAPQTLVADAKGVSMSNQYERTEYTWKAISKIETTDDHILLFHGSTEVVIVPQRAFTGSYDAERFRGFVEGCCTGAGPVPPTARPVGAPPKRRRRSTYSLAVQLLLLALALPVLIIMYHAKKGEKELGEPIRVVMPGEHELNLAKPGTYVIYYEDDDDGRGNPTESPEVPEITCTVTLVKDESEMSLYTLPSPENVDDHEDEGIGIYYFNIDQPGSIRLAAQYTSDQPGPEFILSVRRPQMNLGLAFVLSVCSSTVLVCAAGVIALVTFNRRRRRKRAWRPLPT